MPKDNNWQRFTDSATQVILLAQQETKRLGMQEVGTEHLLLALFRQSDGVAARVLERVGVSQRQVRAELARQGRAAESHTGGAKRLTLSASAKKALEYALLEAHELNAELGVLDFADTEHLLLGLLHEGAGGNAVRLLESLSVSPERVRQEILNDLNGIASPPTEPAPELELPDAFAPPSLNASAYAQALALGIRVFVHSKAFPEEVGSLTEDLRRASRAVCLALMAPEGSHVSGPGTGDDLGDAGREIMRTQVLLDFAVGYGCLDEKEAGWLQQEYNALRNELGGLHDG